MDNKEHLHLAHKTWEALLQPGDWVIDATCGNGRDTLKLAQLIQPWEESGLIAIDIQAVAIKKTRTRLKEKFNNVYLFEQSHESFPEIAKNNKIKLIVYNLGYLPWGDQSLTTLCQSTLESFHAACALLVPGGMLSFTCYPGHKEGALEEIALLQEASKLDSGFWKVIHHRFNEKSTSPTLLFIQKTIF